MLDPHDTLPFKAQVHAEARAAKRITWDSREVTPEVAFVALAGDATHGNLFIEKALESGAPFVITDKDVPRAVKVTDAKEALIAWAVAERAKNKLVVGITVSAGKTTAKSYAAAALDAHYMPVFNTIPAIACFLIEFGSSKKPLVVEMGIDRIGEMSELVELVKPSVGVVTTIGPAHLEQLGSVENIAYEKGLILQSCKLALVGKQASSWYPEHCSYGFGATYSGENLRISASEASFEYKGSTINLPLASKVQAEAAVLGMTLAQWAGVPLGEAAGRIEKVTIPGGRYRVISGAFTIIDDTYNASPVAVKAALDSLSALEGRRISVLGRMLELGHTERELHAEVGSYAKAKADISFGVGEFASELGERAFRTVPELRDALLAEIKSGDVVLIKASRGISWNAEKRAQEGVGLDSLLSSLQELQKVLSGS